MKLAAILAVLVLIGLTSAEIENAKVNGFNISFDFNQNHDTKIDSGDGTNGSMIIRTFEGSFTCDLVRFPEPIQVNSTWLNEQLIAFRTNGIPAEEIEVDGSEGILAISMSGDTGEPIFALFYYPSIKSQKANAFISGSSTLPFYETSDLLRTIKITF